MQEAFDFLKKADTWFLATVDGGAARVRPFSNVNLFEDKLYIQTGKVKSVSKQLIANPEIELCAMVDGWTLRIAATAVTDERVSAKQAMIDANPLLIDWFKADDDNTHVLYLQGATAHYSHLFDGERTETF
ncbi:MAG: pyridoxamine 5'-phosphate oxidase family protein [Oscillospiraceae bacterium]|nr:pyridoxamine 5'-phosphate oxidase family protein [Oscillospiraceae bacterium]